ncbi:hypothetical protein EDC04DRAFT_2612958 [Pisolithus marmoratus]|nr:hypothetical protein EDC04DRAFT_2612958 [Pisolithus marmoratus]
MDSFDDTDNFIRKFPTNNSQYDILSPDLTSCIWFATTAMHAYGHEWACQLIYNPQIVKGLGLSDGKGTERLWSRFIRLIGIECSSLHQCCIWLIDWHAASVAKDMVNDLGNWLRLNIAIDAPARLKKELDTVLTLQTKLDSSGRALQGI